MCIPKTFYSPEFYIYLLSFDETIKKNMSRVKNVDTEMEVKPGRRTRSILNSESVDSPLRRSSRVKSAGKQNESSPESPLSDSNNVNNTPTLRNTRRRTDALNNSALTERSRTLRSRRNSGIDEPTSFSKQLTRAGSESKSPPTTGRPIRKTRASSMEPTANIENNDMKTNNSDIAHTPINTRRHRSILPTGKPAIEENEEMMIPVVELDRVLPNLKEIKEASSESIITEDTNQSMTESKNSVDTVSEGTCKEKTDADMNARKEDTISVENSPVKTIKEVKMNTPINKVIVPDNSERSLNDTINSTQVETLIEGVSKIQPQISSEVTPRKLGLKTASYANKTIEEEDELLDNKENQEANIIENSKNTDVAVSTVLLQSPKLAKNNISLDKSVKESDENADSTDNTQNVMVTDTDSLSEIALNDSIDEKGSCIEVCEDSSLDSNIVILKCPENDNDINSLSQYSDTEDQNGTCADMRVDSNKDGEVGANKSLRLENSTEEQLQHVTSEDETIKSDKNNISSGDMHIDSNKDGEIAANMSLKLENSTEEQLQHITLEDETIKNDKNNTSSEDMHIDSNRDAEIVANMSLQLENSTEGQLQHITLEDETIKNDKNNTSSEDMHIDSNKDGEVGANMSLQLENSTEGQLQHITLEDETINKDKNNTSSADMQVDSNRDEEIAANISLKLENSTEGQLQHITSEDETINKDKNNTSSADMQVDSNRDEEIAANISLKLENSTEGQLQHITSEDETINKDKNNTSSADMQVDSNRDEEIAANISLKLENSTEGQLQHITSEDETINKDKNNTSSADMQVDSNRDEEIAANISLKLENSTEGQLQHITLEDETINKDKNVETPLTSKTGTNADKEVPEDVCITPNELECDEFERNKETGTLNISKNLADTDLIKCSNLSDTPIVKASTTLILPTERSKDDSLRQENEGKDSSDVDTKLTDFEANSVARNEDNIINETEGFSDSPSSAKQDDKMLETNDKIQNSLKLDDSLMFEKECKIDSNTQIKIEENEIPQIFERQDEMSVNDNHPDENVSTNLFKDIPAEEWKEKTFDINSVHSMSTERLGNESENECDDFVLVDKEASHTPESTNNEKEKKSLNYDSDDTVLLKTKKDDLKGKRGGTTSPEVQCEMSENKLAAVINRRKSMQQEEINERRSLRNDLEVESENGKESTQNQDKDSPFNKRKSKNKLYKSVSSTPKLVKELDDEVEKCDKADTVEEIKSLNKSPIGSPSSTSGTSKSIESMDSDIEREYNLHGVEMSKFSDDDVPGDECRASETESSDPDDDGSDLADFVVNDDDISEEEIEPSEIDEELYSPEDDDEEKSNEDTIDKLCPKIQVEEENEEEEIEKEKQKETDTDTFRKDKRKSTKSKKLSLAKDKDNDRKITKSEIESSKKKKRKNKIESSDDEVYKGNEEKIERNRKLHNRNIVNANETGKNKQEVQVQESKGKVTKKKQGKAVTDKKAEVIQNKFVDTAGEGCSKFDEAIQLDLSENSKNVKRKAGAEIVSKKIKKNKMKNDDGERIQKENAIQNYKIQNAKCSMVDSSRKGIKRLSSDVIGNLPDARMKVFKNPESQKLPSRLMPRSLLRKNKINVKQDFISLSSYGSTSNFYVSNIQKIKKANMNSEVQSFRQKMLNRNPRQPISHYTMFLEKQKASNNHYPSDKSY